MSSTLLTADHEAFRISVRTLLDEQVVPALPGWEEQGRIPGHAWKTLGAAGLLGLAHPIADGGTGHDLLSSVVAAEELGRTGFSGFRAAVGVHTWMATHYLATAAAPALRHRYLGPAIRGERVAALAVTEPDAGSDLTALATTATPDGDGFRLHGTKTMVTNALCGGFAVIAARTGPATRGPTGISLFVTDLDAPGLTVTPQPLAAWHCAGTAQLGLDGVPLPADALIGRAGRGFHYLMKGFQQERVIAAALAVGGVDRCLHDTLDHVQRRALFGGRAGDLQSVRHALAGMHTELSAARLLVHDAAHRLARGDLPVAECSAAKLYATELACRVADRCLHLHGSAGFVADSSIARAHREARAAALAAGPSEVMLDLIAGTLFSTTP
ncbi:acyl-CoA dehydrogenase family protein [Kineosporia sp. J2-2]|uniref:Medium-chain specific acyl-CoA dehydrogenase, mitochondrial n=1 Tax=Kineosporia corallincola TaxID=2835133 RepID=A0ABS5TRQ7_9ACTN|nr:acyl-CoA dehydrogenase family protein [Kineosporia corallincola]MBT0773480.1 acyl-CoA dehydrogenase family protein [Kineosporia corallincola]